MSNKRRKKGGRTTERRPAPTKKPKKKVEPFPLSIGAMLNNGLDGMRREPIALLAGALLPVLGTLPLQFPAAAAFADDRTAGGIFFTIVGMMVGGALSYPWCLYALRTSRNDEVDLMEPFRDWHRFIPMLVASFWFWAGMLLAFQFQILGGLPAVAIVMAYAFFGFVIVDRHDQGGLKALGTSVRIGDGRRFALAAIICVFLVIWMLAVVIGGTAATAIGLSGSALGIAATIPSIPFVAFSLVSWASLYDVIRKDLPDAW